MMASGALRPSRVKMANAQTVSRRMVGRQESSFGLGSVLAVSAILLVTAGISFTVRR